MTTDQIHSIICNLELTDEFFDFIDGCDDLTISQALTNFYETEPTPDCDVDDEKVLALMEYTGDDYEECDKYIFDDKYLVLNDDEADEEWTESIDNYIDECLIPTMPACTQRYFDYDKFHSEARLNGSRGEELATYDGDEGEQIINETIYYIYRLN